MEDPGLLADIFVAVLLFVCGRGLLSLTQHHRATLPFQLKLFGWAFAVRFGFSIVIYQFGLVQILGDADSSGWWGGMFLYWKWNQQGFWFFDLPSVLIEAFEGHHRGYGYLVGTLFFITDLPARLGAAALNCLLGALTVILVYRMAATLFSEWVAVRVGWLTCFMPSLVIWSAQTVKEPVVIFLETVALYGSIQLKRSGFSVRHILLCCLAIVLLIPFRFYAVYLAGAAVLLALAWPQFTAGNNRLGTAIGVAALGLPLIMLSGATGQHEKQFQSWDVARIQGFKNAVARGPGGGSGVEMNYDLNTHTGMGMATLVGAAHLLLAPFPWQLGGGTVRKLATAPELVFWWWLFFAGVVPGLRHAIKHRFSEVQPLLLFLLGMGLLYSVMFGNVGLVYRQRAQLMPWLLIFAAVGLEQRKLRKAVGFPVGETVAVRG